MTDRTQAPAAKFRRGQPATAEALNGALAPLNALLQGTAPGSTAARGTAIGLRVARFQIASNAGDYLTAYRVLADDTLATEVTYLAKPPQLRNSVAALGSATYTYSATDTRTATVGGDTESQVVVPAWTIGEEIRAEAGILGGTGVTVTLAGIATALQWEARTAGRAWAKVAA